MATQTAGPHRSNGLDLELGAVQSAARAFMVGAMRARDVRIIRMASSDAPGCWEVEAEILVPDPEIERLGPPFGPKVLEARHCTLRLDSALGVLSYEFADERRPRHHRSDNGRLTTGRPKT